MNKGFITACTILLMVLSGGSVFAAADGMLTDAEASQSVIAYGPWDLEETPIEFILGEKHFELALGDFLTNKKEGVFDKRLKIDAGRIYKLAPFINRVPDSAEVTMNDEGVLEIEREKPGMRIDLDALEKELLRARDAYDFSPIELKYSFVPAHVISEDLEPVLSRLNELMERSLTLTTVPQDTLQTSGKSQADTYIFNLKDHFDLLEVDFTTYIDFGGKKIPVSMVRQDSFADALLKTDWVIGVNEQAIDSYIREELSAELEIPAQDVTIVVTWPKEGETDDGQGDLAEAKIEFEGTAQNGIQINRGTLADHILQALHSPEEVESRDTVIIPLEEVRAVIHSPEVLRERGITELFSVGYSNFYGSTWKRIHNINTGIARFNGVIIPQGEVFSFNQRLGPVDASTGYLEELVIKGDKTEPDYGGGLCQVSSTFFRAGLFGGLDIIQRKAHSYAVSYYSRPGGHGLDCTIYPGVADCKLLNDTPGDLLIQAYTDGADAYFKFYGTTDGRTVSLDGPYYSNRVGAPPDKILYDPNLPEDFYEEKEQPHNGFDAVWYRTVVRADSTEQMHTFHSKYQARPRVILRGGRPVEGSDATVLENGY